VLGINQRYFTSSKNAVKCLGPKIRKQIKNNNNNFQFILLAYLFRAPRLDRKSQLQNWWSLPWPGSVSNIILLHAQFTKNSSISTNLRSHVTSWLRHCQGPIQTSFCGVSFLCTDYAIVSRISFTRMNHRESPYGIFSTPSSKE